LYPAAAHKPATAPQPTSGARRFIYGFLGAALAGILALGGFNYTINPLGYYPPRLVKPLAWGDQLQKLDLMRTAPAPALLILGSSRTMKLAPADATDLTGLTAFNGGVSSSRPEEWYAMLRHSLDDLHWQPKEIVLGIDMETLFYAGEPNEDLLSSGELRSFLPYSMWVGSLWDRSKLLVSLDQLQLSKKAIIQANHPTNTPPGTSFDADGYLHYYGWEKAVADGSFRLVTIYQVKNYQERYAGAAAMNPQRKALFEQMLALAAAHGIKVHAFFTPFQPTVLAAMEQVPTFTHVHAAMRTYVDQLVLRFPNATFADFTDISAFGGDPTNFFDGVHYRQENARLILKSLLRP
jgi:nucleotide-binding universal stress UspA family protein